MMWLMLVLLASLLDSIRIFIDNFLSDTFFKGKLAVSQKCFIIPAELVTALILMAITDFNFGNTELYIFFLIIFAGAIYTIGGIPYFKALEIEESTNIGIFIQLSPILYLILGWLFLNESFSINQLFAIPIILLAPIIIVANTRKRSRKIKLRAILYAFIYVLFAVIGNLIFIKTISLKSNQLDFFNVTAFFYLGMCISNIIIIATHPKWRKRFFSVAKKNKLKLLAPMTANFIINIIKNLTYRAGLLIAPTVAIASAASDSVEPIIIFFMGIVLTLIWPQFGREKLQKKTILVHLVATVLVVVGIVLLQLPNV
ncbi:EamA family transporter [Candidatus Saccharibacteria bacterium]|nr:EamA family transporter [Candidatus Saccharibacteria bacterium]